MTIDRGDVEKKRVVGKKLKLVRPTAESLLDDAMTLIGVELRRQLDLAVTGELDKEDIIRFQKATDAMVKLSREERERLAADDPADASLEELLAEAGEYEKTLTAQVRVAEYEEAEEDVSAEAEAEADV